MGILHKNTPTTGLAAPATNAETVVYTTPAISAGAGIAGGGNPVSISGTVNVTPGTSTTAIVVRVRQGSLTGPLVGGSPSHTVAAAAPQSISFGATDVSGFLQTPGAYVITVQQTAGSANGVTNQLDVEVIV